MVKKKAGKGRYGAPRAAGSKSAKRTRLRGILFTIGTLLIVAAILIFLVLRSGNTITLPENAVGTIIAPVQNFFARVTGGIKEFVTNWRNYDALQEEYDKLAMENQQLSLELTGAEEDMLENARLQALLDAKDRYETLDPIYAKVIARDPSPWFTGFSLNRGSSDGVYSGMAVVNGDGLIGRVTEVGLTYSKVTTIIDARSAVACLIQRTRDNGVMRGQSASSDVIAQCFVYYLPNVNSIMPGDAVVTSGTDSVYPKGIKVGSVTAVSLDAGSEGTYAVVAPSVDFRHIEDVFILRTVVETDTDVLPNVATPSPEPYRQAAEETPKPGTTATPAPDDAAEQIYARPTAIPIDGSAGISGYRIEDLPEDEWANE